MDEKKLKKLSLKLTSNRDDYMSAFRKNVFLYVDQKDITLSEIAEKADIPFSTLRSFLYGNATDCKLSTAVRLARAFNISVDELIGAETIEPETKECVALARNLKEHHRYVIRSFVGISICSTATFRQKASRFQLCSLSVTTVILKPQL